MNLSQFKRILAQTLLLPVLALGLVAGILVLQLHSAQRTVTAIQASDESIAATTLVEKLLVDEETGLRGYQITADMQFLEPYHKAAQPLNEALHTLRRNLQIQHESTQPVDAIRGSYQTWEVSYAEPLISAIAAGGDTRDVELNVRGKQQMDAIRQQLDNVLSRQADIRRQEAARWLKQAHRTVLALVLLTISVGVLISAFTVNRLHHVSETYQATLEGLRRHAQATFESEERLRTTLTSIGDGVIVCSPEGKIELINTIAEELTGYSHEEAIGKPLNEVFRIVNESTREPVETPIEKVARLHRVVGLANHTVLLRRDGSEIQIDDSGAPVFDRSGALSGIVMVFRDITEQRSTQNALLATEKLAVAGRLAATIAHEIHNPLDSVVNLLFLVKDETNPQVTANYLDLAQQELGRMGQISRAMLGLYRESKSPVTINVKEMLDSVLVLLDRQIKQSQVTLSAEVPEQMELQGYPAELRQVFTNLVANAADAASPNGHITLKASRSQGPGRTTSGVGRAGVIIEVSDTGPGIENATLEHIFEPFFTTKGEHGTGLGLWVSRGIIDKHGGTIDIRSRTGADDHGTTITVFLPRMGIAAAGAAPPSHV